METLEPTKTIGTTRFAEILGCSSMSIIRWAREGKIPKPTFTVGRNLRWNLREVEDWLCEQDMLPGDSSTKPLPAADGDSRLGVLIEAANSLADEAESLLAKTHKVQTQLQLLNREQQIRKGRGDA